MRRGQGRLLNFFLGQLKQDLCELNGTGVNQTHPTRLGKR